MTLKTLRISTSEWIEKAFCSKKGRPSATAINNAIKNGSLSGAKYAGKYFVHCDMEYEPLWNGLDAKPKKTEPINPDKIENTIASNILKKHLNNVT